MDILCNDTSENTQTDDDVDMVSDQDGHLHETCERLKECFSMLRKSYSKEKEVRKIQKKAVQKVRSIYEEVFDTLQNVNQSSEQPENNEDLSNGNISDTSQSSRECVNSFDLERVKNSRGNTSKFNNHSYRKFQEIPQYFMKYSKVERNSDSSHDVCLFRNDKYALNKDEKFWKKFHYNNFRYIKRQDEEEYYSKLLNEDINFDEEEEEFSKICELDKTIEKLNECDRQLTEKISRALQNNNECSEVMKIINSQKFDKQEYQQMKVTVPKPFHFTPSKKLPKTELKLDDKQEMKFHANPIPDHIYRPLYKEIVEKAEIRRKERKEEYIKKLTSLIKPFNFTTDKHEYRKQCQSMPDLLHTSPRKYFRANPVPTFMYEKSLKEKTEVEEMERQMRIKLRAEKLLKESSFPFSERDKCFPKVIKKHSQSLGDLRVPKSKNEQRDQKSKYDELLNARITTVCQPFYFRTAERYSEKVKNVKIKHGDYRPVSCISCSPPKKSFHSPKPLTSPSYPVAKKNASTILRDIYIKEQLQIKKKQMEEELHKLREKLRKQHYFLKTYGWKFKMLDTLPDVNKTIEDKVKSNRESELQRQHEYKTELKEMEERIHQRPLLIEMQAIRSEKKRLEKCYEQALKRAGLDFQFVEELSEKYKEQNKSITESPCDSNEDNDEAWNVSKIEDSSSDSDDNQELNELKMEEVHSESDGDDKTYTASSHSEDNSEVKDESSQCSQQSVISKQKSSTDMDSN